MKLYYEGRDTPAVREGIASLAREGSPGAAFLWPQDIVMHANRFGYMMPLAPKTFVPLRAVMANEVSLGFGVALEVALQIVEGFRRLHAKGFHYCDISDGNVLLDPNTGRVLICDNDNVGTAQRPATIQGTPGFMAPEVGRRAVTPSADSDKFSLGVLLFMLLIGEHPLEGRREAECTLKTQQDIDEMYCLDPVFIFDPDNATNRPVPGWQDNAILRWPLFPSGLHDVFVRLFTAGLLEPGRRPSFSEWNTALVEARDLLVRCADPDCGAESFFPPRSVGGTVECWACGRPAGQFGRLAIATRRGLEFDIVLDDGTIIRRYHLTGRLEEADSGESVVGMVVENPNAPGVWGIRNLSTSAWRATFPSGEVVETPPGRAVALRDGVVIDFRTATATISFEVS